MGSCFLTLIKLGGYESHLRLDFCLTIQGFVCLGLKLSFSSKVVAASGPAAWEASDSESEQKEKKL